MALESCDAWMNFKRHRLRSDLIPSQKIDIADLKKWNKDGTSGVWNVLGDEFLSKETVAYLWHHRRKRFLSGLFEKNAKRIVDEAFRKSFDFRAGLASIKPL